MARYTGPVCKLCRREGVKLFLKGDKCMTKCTLERRNTRPGQHGGGRPRKESGYASNCVKSRGCAAPMGYWSASFVRPLIALLVALAKPVRTCCKSWRCAWITWCIAWALPIHEHRLVSLCVMGILP